MARIKNVDLPDNKRIEIGLTYIHGIGRKLSRQILTKLDINLDTKVKDLILLFEYNSPLDNNRALTMAEFRFALAKAPFAIFCVFSLGSKVVRVLLTLISL